MINLFDFNIKTVVHIVIKLKPNIVIIKAK